MQNPTNTFRRGRVWLLSGLAVVFAACNASTFLVVASMAVMSIQGMTTIPQHKPGVMVTEVFPGQVNVWDLDRVFAIIDGGDDQFDNALTLRVGATLFPSTDYADIIFHTPVRGTADGLIPVVVDGGPNGTFDTIISGQYTALTGLRSFGYMCQDLNLIPAVAPISLDWTDDVDSGAGGPFSSGAPPTFFRVVLRNLVGDLLATLLSVTGDPGLVVHSMDISAYAGERVRLCFEWRNISSYGYSSTPFTRLDDVSVTDGLANEFVTNGGFESGFLDGWMIGDAPESTNLQSGTMMVEGLEVTRWFYTDPNTFWGRMVDVFHNPTGAPIVKTVEYYTDLGSDADGVIYLTPGTGGEALSTWDSYFDPADRDRDVGWAFGTADSVVFLGATGLSDSSGSDDIYIEFDIVVPAGGTVALVNFIVMNGVETAGTATSVADLATHIDSVNNWIVANWGVASALQVGIPDDVLAAIANF